MSALLTAGTILLAAQIVRVQRTNPGVQHDVSAPTEIEGALRRACYDCHSNETAWPWYSAVAPLSWWIRHDVDEGRRRLNFSAWDDYISDPGTEEQKLSKMARMVGNREMAPWYYRGMHREARLSDSERDAIVRWISAERSKLSTPASKAGEQNRR